MFTWICPQCGREVLPSQSECPACADRAKAAAQPQPQAPPPVQPPSQAPPQYAPPPSHYAPQAPPQYAQPVQPPPQYAPPAQQYAPPPPQQQYAAPPSQQFAPPQQPPYAPPQQPAFGAPPMQYGPPPAKGLPQWLVMVLVAGGMLTVGFLAYKYLLPSSKSASDDTETVATGKPKAGAKKAADGKVHPYMKHLEVAGIRLSEDARQRLVVKMTVINHSAADLSGLKLLVSVKTKGKGAATLSEVPVDVPNLGPLESKDVSATVPTKLRAYELPDWQFLETSFEITAP